MKKILLIPFFIIPCLLLLSTQTTKATHAVGMNIFYVHDTLNTYTVTVKFYRNCGDPINPNPAAAPFTQPVYYSSASCGFSNSVTLSQAPGSGAEIPTGQFPPCYVTACQGGTGYGVQEYVYVGSVTLPSNCNDWVFSSYVNARNATITTMSTPGNLSLYVESTLDNSSFPGNNSAIFSTYPVSRFCIGHTFNYNQGATDPDGDSLVFSLVDALSANFGAPPVPITVPYIPPYTGANPISSIPPVVIDPQTGVITFTPNVIQVGAIAVLVQEYRNGVLIGSVRRDMQVNIEATCNFPPVLQPSTFNSISVDCGDSTLYIHLLSPVECSSVAADGSDFRMLSPSGNPIPIISAVPINCTSAGLTDSIRIKLYAPALTANGIYYLWSKVGSDGNTLTNDCNTAMAEYDTASFSFYNCWEGAVDLTNVSVDSANAEMEISWVIPLDLPDSIFRSFEIYRSNYPGGPYYPIASLTDSSANFYVDDSVHVPVQPYNYAIRVQLNYGYVGPFCDSIQSIYLTSVLNADSATINLNWTPYWGWPNPLYKIAHSDDNGLTWKFVDGATTSDTSFIYTKPAEDGGYLVRIYTDNGSLISLSNWYDFNVTKLTVPNVITPNGDGLNDTFFFQNLEPYPNSKLSIFNRWGRKVYESSSYKNDWTGDNLSEGVYFYTLKVGDSKATEMSGTVNIIRDK